RTPPRRPQVFRLDEAAITMAPREPVEPDFSLPVPAAKPSRGWGLSLAGLFWSALGGVLSLMAYVGLSQLIGDLFS
ncbi:hypothetical protein NL388_36130, partial [Klebsiella pneumoniae]|nr:hypothetical protein [Klebsiella pneumoniae]